MRPLPEEHYGTHACNDTHPWPTLRTGVRDMKLAAPRDAQARPKGHTGLVSRRPSHPLAPLPREAMDGLARANRRQRDTGHATRRPATPSLPNGPMRWGARAGGPRPWAASGGRDTARSPWAPGRREPYGGP